ncbi:hypothetical protein F0U61_07595 [Archangium violaceum]|uniref:hypothetical protein n=1 Tax=Archangium violaceum TaxID=83451 RepID=UPI002B282C13|nr:hypothetical protein F0U61_07595 [Archangium violaceum]
MPFDPVLAEFYARSRRMAFGELEGFFLYRVDNVSDLARENEEVHWGWPEVFRTSLIVFAGEPALLYCFATVPGLADADGVQPVVKIDPYEDVVAIPVASSVDRFFDAYSHALERRMELIRQEAEFNARFEAEFGPSAPDSLRTLVSKDTPGTHFPWSVTDLMARDASLVELLRAGRFDFLMGGSEDIHQWVEKVLAAANT